MTTPSKTEWFEDDSFWIDQYPVMFSEQRFTEAADQAEKLIKLVNPQGREVLDLGCGPGRFAIPLAQKGFRVTGVDRTAFLLEKARMRAEATQVEIGWVQQDMREFIRPAAFDLIISMFTSFGYFADRRDDLTVLRSMLRNLVAPVSSMSMGRKAWRGRCSRQLPRCGRMAPSWSSGAMLLTIGPGCATR